jgi:hypothetical protein
VVDQICAARVPGRARVASERNRYGARAGVAFAVVALSLCASRAYALDIAVHQLTESSYELVLSNTGTLDEGEARAYISRVAASVCNGRTPVLGRYRFEAMEPVESGMRGREPGSYRFTQEVTCSVSAPPSSDARQPTLGSPEGTQAIQAEIGKKSEAYFRLLAAKQFEEAFAEASGPALGADQAKWKQDNQAFQAIAGEPVTISIVKITVYDNPAEAPEPGLYVAADFSNTYANVPIHCGYLVWYRPVGGREFKITRLETGYVTSEQLKGIPGSQLPDIKQRLRCVGP